MNRRFLVVLMSITNGILKEFGFDKLMFYKELPNEDLITLEMFVNDLYINIIVCQITQQFNC